MQKYMRKTISCIMACLLLFCLSGCGAEQNTQVPLPGGPAETGVGVGDLSAYDYDYLCGIIPVNTVKESIRAILEKSKSIDD